MGLNAQAMADAPYTLVVNASGVTLDGVEASTAAGFGAGLRDTPPAAVVVAGGNVTLREL